MLRSLSPPPPHHPLSNLPSSSPPRKQPEVSHWDCTFVISLSQSHPRMHWNSKHQINDCTNDMSLCECIYSQSFWSISATLFHVGSPNLGCRCIYGRWSVAYNLLTVTTCTWCWSVGRPAGGHNGLHTKSWLLTVNNTLTSITDRVVSSYSVYVVHYLL